MARSKFSCPFALDNISWLDQQLSDVLFTDIFSSLAYAELKLILARILYNFDMELVDPDEDWMDQKAFFIWTKPPLNIYLTPVR